MDNKKKVPLMNKLAYGIGTGGGCIFNQIAAAFLLNYYTDTALIGAGAIATMFLVCRIFDGITDFVMGGIIDKTSSKLGKARPWLIASAPLTLIGIVLLMNVPMGLSDGGKLVYAYLTYIFMNCIVYTIYGISNTALLPLMTRDKDDSTMLATFSALGNNIIGLVAGLVITPLVLNLGWKTSSVILGGAACVLILISGLVNKEMDTQEEIKEKAHIPMSEQLPATLKNKYFWLLFLLGAFSLVMNANAIGGQIFYCNMVLNNPMFMSVLMTAGQLPGIFILFLMPSISKKWSKQTFLLIGSVLLIIGFAITGLAGGNLAAMLGMNIPNGQFSGEEGKTYDTEPTVALAIDQFGPMNFLTMDGQARANGISHVDHDSAESPESKYLGGAIQEKKELAQKANPATYAGPDMCKFLVQHGSADVLVPYEQSVEFADVIRQKCGDDMVEFTRLEGANHEDKMFFAEDNMNLVFAFIEKNLDMTGTNLEAEK